MAELAFTLLLGWALGESLKWLGSEIGAAWAWRRYRARVRKMEEHG